MVNNKRLLLRLVGYPVILVALYSCYYIPVGRLIREGQITANERPPGVDLGVAVEGAVGPAHPFLDNVPHEFDKGRVGLINGQLVIHVSGEPAEMGTQYGTLLKYSIRKMAEEYIEKAVVGEDNDQFEMLLQRVRTMRPSLPRWYQDELAACANAVSMDPDLLLLAQCEGDILSLGDDDVQFDPDAELPEMSFPEEDSSGSGKPGSCSGYVVFGKKEINDGELQVGRNFDYFGSPVVKQCSVVNYFSPAKGHGYPFASVGWTGILGGWTLVNSEGLVVANNLGGGTATNPKGIPTLIMTRILAQKAGTIDEAIAIIKQNPRMRGQILWMGQPGDVETGRPDRAVMVEYDANDVYVKEATNGILITTNTNQCFGGRTSTPTYDFKYNALRAALREPPKGRRITESALSITLHSVEVFPTKGYMVVAHGTVPAQDGTYVRHTLP